MYIFRICLLAAALCCIAGSAEAQPVRAGDAVVTCEAVYGNSFTVGRIELQNANTAPLNVNWSPPMHHGLNDSWTVSNTGQVFGIALDKDRNILVAATSVYYGNAFGPAGAGGIYKIVGAGTVTNFIFTNPAAVYSNSAANKNKIPNLGSGLGNICYDPDHDQFFVTNFEDGTIYRISNAGATIASRFDPLALDAGQPGWAPLGERLWGVGYNRGRLYYSVWKVDCGYSTTGAFNSIRSVGINSTTGDFVPGSDRHEFDIPHMKGLKHSNPVADIEFSVAGTMLLGERTMSSAGLTGKPVPSAHASRVLEYRLSGSWIPTGPTFSVGVAGASSSCPVPNPALGAGSAGGVDYGFSGMDSVRQQTLKCDSMVWSTGDCLGPGNGCFVYGLQGMQWTGGVNTNSVLIDFGAPAKTQIGDVDIVKTCNPPVPPLCDRFTITAAPDTAHAKIFCCWNITVGNNSGGPAYTDVTAHILTPGVSFSNGSVAIPPGWSITQLTPDVRFHYTGGPGIPAGNTGPLQFCLDIGSTTTQQIQFTLTGGNLPPCVKTLTFDCRGSSTPGCALLKDVKISCSKAGADGATYALSFSIKNLSSFTATGGTLIVNSPAGAVVTPGTMLFNPAIAPTGTTPVQNFTVTVPASAGDKPLCLSVVLHRGEPICLDACHIDTCIILPPCRDCCRGIDQKVLTGAMQQRPNGIVRLPITANPPGGTIHATATVVAAYRRTLPGFRCPGSSWLPISGDIVNPQPSWGGLPLITIPAPFGIAPPGPFRDAAWGTIPAGVPMGSSPLTLDIRFPNAPSSFRCRDQLRFCVRYTFTDRDCRTCDTMVCYVMTRMGGHIFIDHRKIDPSGFAIFEGPTAHEVDSDAGGAKEREQDILGAADEPELASITMSSDNAGTLTVAVPSLPAGDPDPVASLTIVGLDFQPPHTVELRDIDGVRPVEGTASISTHIENGRARAFALQYNNPNGEKIFANLIRYRMVVSSNPNDTLESGWSEVYSRVPGNGGGDSIGIDTTSPEPTGVRTFALYFRNTNRFRQDIAEVTLSVDGGRRILAVGPPADSTTVSLVPLLVDSARIILTPRHASEDVTTIPGGVDLRPIYLTVSHTGGDTARIRYTTRNSSGAIIGDGDLLMSDPLIAGVTRRDDPIGTGASMLLMDPYPNPVSGPATIGFHLPGGRHVTLEVYDMAGRQVARLMDGEYLPGGDHAVIFQADELATGSYLIQLRAGGSVLTRVMQVVR